MARVEMLRASARRLGILPPLPEDSGSSTPTGDVETPKNVPSKPQVSMEEKQTPTSADVGNYINVETNSVGHQGNEALENGEAGKKDEGSNLDCMYIPNLDYINIPPEVKAELRALRMGIDSVPRQLAEIKQIHLVPQGSATVKIQQSLDLICGKLDFITNKVITVEGSVSTVEVRLIALERSTTRVQNGTSQTQSSLTLESRNLQKKKQNGNVTPIPPSSTDLPPQSPNIEDDNRVPHVANSPSISVSNHVFQSSSVSPLNDSISVFDVDDKSWAGWVGYKVITVGSTDGVKTLYKEYAHGRNGQRSIKKLLAMKSEDKGFLCGKVGVNHKKWSKLKTVIHFVEVLASKPGWDVDRAISYLISYLLRYTKKEFQGEHRKDERILPVE